MKQVIRKEDMEWQPHPSDLPGVKMKVARSRERDGTEGSIAWVLVEKGAGVPLHVHRDSDDNLYILEGRAKMRMDGKVFDIDQGCQITVPKGTGHEIFDVEEDLLIYNVFSPGTF